MERPQFWLINPENKKEEWIDFEFIDTQAIFDEYLEDNGYKDGVFVLRDSEGIPNNILALYKKDNDKFWEWIQAYNEDGEEFALAVSVYFEWINENAEISEVRENYCGEWKSFEEFCEEFFYANFSIPESLDNYIDWEAVANDMRHDYYYDEDTGVVFINA